MLTLPHALRILPLIVSPLLGVGCTEPQVQVDLQVEMSDLVTTVGDASVTVTGDGVSAVRIEATIDDQGTVLAFDATATAADDTSGGSGWNARLLGLKASTEYSLRAVATIDGVPHESEPVVVLTGRAPEQLPTFQATVHDPEQAIQGYLATAVQARWAMPVIFDTDGDVVWWHFPSEDQEVVYTARLLRDGSGVVYIRNDADRADLVVVDWDGTERLVTPVRQATHDLIELPDGRIGFIYYDRKLISEELVYGDGIMELDMETLELRPVWTAFTDIEYDPNVQFEGDITWTHANALDYDQATDSYSISLRNYDTIARISRTTGEVLEYIGGPFSEVRDIHGSTELFQGQHGFEWTAEDQLLVFDNGDANGERSSAREYHLDRERGLATEIFRYQTDPTLYCYALGDVVRLDNQDTLVVWSTAGQADQVDADGYLRWRLSGGIGGALGYSTFHERLGQPVP